MIIKNFEISKISSNKNNIFLLYGKNEGLQNEIIEKNFIINFKGNINKYDESEFINNYQTISSEILTKSLFEDKRIVIISRVGGKILKFIEELTEKNIEDTTIILKAGLLEKKSTLRNFFEKSKKLIVIPFYEDDNRTLTSLTYEFLSENKISLSRESVNLLVGRVSGNRENLKNELKKILHYTYTNKDISIETVKKLSNLSENHNVNELADNYLVKNKRKLVKILNENIYSDEDCVLILRTILIKSKRLMNIIESYNKNQNLEDVISKAKPPIFWKDKETVRKQANTWNLEDLKNKIYQINEVENLVKINSKNSLNLVSDFILNY